MSQQQTSRLSLPDFTPRGSFLGRLPKNVRRVGTTFHPNLQETLLEFVVVVGNASWREGEHFYLTAEQARRAYNFPNRFAATPSLT